MNKHRNYFFVIISLVGLVSLLIVTSSLFASQSNWTELGAENYQLLADENPIVFTALQDSEKIKIAEEMDRKPGIEKKWSRSRPDIVSQIKIKKITDKNNLEDNFKAETFDVKFEDIDGLKDAKIAKFNVNGKNILSPADPEYSNLPYGLITSQDNAKGLIPTLKGLWFVDANKKETKKITDDTFNGKSFDELTADLEKRLINSGSDGPATIWWNDNPMFNKSGSKIAYGSNRDCVETGGMSLWVNDLETGKEYPVLRDKGNNFYRLVTWMDDEFMLGEKWDNGKPSYFITDTKGQAYEIPLEGSNPELAGIFGDLITYTPDSSAANKIIVGKIDLTKKTVKNIYEKTIEGSIQKWNGFNPFSQDGSKLAIMYLADERGTYRILVSDLANKTETLVKQAPLSEARLQDFNWLDNSRLLVHVMEYKNTPAQISTWVYNLERGN